MAAGSVNVFNTTTNALQLLLNNHILGGQLNGAIASNNYAPNSLSTQRNPSAGNPETATFGGDNTLVVSFPDGTSQQYDVVINPSSAPITEDLQLYIFYNQVVLVINGSGTNIPQSQVIQGRPISG